MARPAVKADDARANNLLLRLFSYSPRSKRKPLEDFCTEALAWCLNNSPKLLKSFLEEAHIPAPAVSLAGIKVHTQMGFRTAKGEEEQDNGEDNEIRGRFDLVLLQLSTAEKFVLVVECKIGAEFGDNQLENYQKQLSDRTAFQEIPLSRRFLVALTDHSEKHPLDRAEGRLRWSLIFKLLQQAVRDTSAIVPDLTATRFVLRQFAVFLEEKGMNLELPKLSNQLVTQYVAAQEFRTHIETLLLRRVRDTNPELKKRLKNRVEFEQNENGAWFGVYNKDSMPDFYLGIQLMEKQDPWYGMFVQAECPDAKARKGKLDKAVYAEFGVTTELDSNYVILRKKIENTYNGDAEAVTDWLGHAAVFLSSLLWKKG